MAKGCDQTHFLGITVSGQLAETIAACRRWMYERYGCKSGHQTPPHVTLIPPFTLPNDLEIREFERVLSGFAAGQTPFQARFRGFGAFAERTVFARVEPDDRWNVWHERLNEAIHAAFPELLRRDRRPFTPHLTVSNRDIPAGAIPETLKHFAELDLDATVPVDHIVLFERTGPRWEIRNGWYTN